VKADICQHCQADVAAEPQAACEAYDHVEIPPVAPEITRITLFGGICPCCSRKFKAAAPADMAQGSPFGFNLRALVIHLRFTQGIALERLRALLRDVHGLGISEGAILNSRRMRSIRPAPQRRAATIHRPGQPDPRPPAVGNGAAIG
jgi:transposase